MNFFSVTLLMTLMLITGGVGVQAKTQEIKMLPWERVNEVLPRYSKFTVEDLETGEKFEVQRRAGSHHADVQPITFKDTKIMKEIYNGQWSWKRRSIIVRSKGRRIAASMHGMPHGAGALKNNFPGHFCIHFYGSTTHRTNFMDLSHKLMILKAADELEKYMAKADPYELVNAYLAGLKQQDPKIVSAASLQKLNWQEILSTFENVTINRMAVLPIEDLTDELAMSIPVSISMQLHRVGARYYDGVINLARFSPDERWRVDSTFFLEENNIEIKQAKG